MNLLNTRLYAQVQKVLFVLFLLTGISYSANFSASEYASLNEKATKFYGAQRSGDLSNWLVDQHSGSHISFPKDGHSLGRDLSGGWHDAGDFIKFSLTISYSSYTLLKAYDAFGAGFADKDSWDYQGSPDGIPDVLGEAKIATDYLYKTLLNQDSMVSRIGGDQDHSFWTTSPLMSANTAAQGGDPRPVYFGTKADIAGQVAASLALMAKLYQPYDVVYADQLLVKAREVYKYAEANPGQTKEPGESYYADNSYHDNLMCGAIEIYRAEPGAADAQSYLDKAKAYDTQIGSHGWVVDWANPSDFCRHSMMKAGAIQSQSYWKNAVDSYLDKVSIQTYVNGLMYLNQDWGTLQYSQNAAFSAALYYDIFGGQAYYDFAFSQLDYVMGSNEYNRSFVVGFGLNSPTQPHHKNSYGRDDPNWSLNLEHLYELTGAMVGGPTTTTAGGGTTVGYDDVITDYVSNEVSIGYNAGLVGVSAFATLSIGKPTLLFEEMKKSSVLEFNYEQGFIHLDLGTKWKASTVGGVSIFNILGSRVQTLNQIKSQYFRWDIQKLSSGNYHLKVGHEVFAFSKP